MNRRTGGGDTGSDRFSFRSRSFRLCGVAVFFSPLLVLFLIASPAIATPRSIEKIEIDGLSSISKRELLDLLDIKVGEVLDPAKVTTGIKRAFLKGIFEDIEVFADDERTQVRVLVTEKDRIRNISVTGNDHCSTREIRKLFLMKEGQVLRYDLLDGAARQMEKALAERGFPAASVSAALSPTSKPYEKDLTITVREGKPLRVERMTVNGVPAEEVSRVMSIAEGKIYDQEVLKKDLEKVREYYRGQGYLNPKVSFQFQEGRLDIDVVKGKKLVVTFEGNTAFSSKRLLKEVPFFEAGEMRDDLVEDARRKIVSLYHTKGYAFAQVAPVIPEATEKAGDTIEIKFFIFEGERVRVGALTFSGMTLPDKNLKEVLPMKEGDDYNPELLSSDVDVVREFYIALGYLSVDVESPQVVIEKNKAMMTISVKEGPRTLIDKVKITGGSSVSLEEMRKAIRLKAGDPYNEVDIADARSRLSDIFLEKGFLDVQINARVEFSSEGAQLTFEVQEGERTFFGKTIITGNVSTKREVIERELLHKESEPFNAALLTKERQKLYKLGLFTEVRIEGLDRYDHQRDIRIDVVEGDAGSVDFGFGYSNYSQFTVVVDVGYKNLFGMNRQLSLRLGYNLLERLYSLNYYDPWFLNRQLQLRDTVFYTDKEEKNIDTGVILYKDRKYGFSIGVAKQYTDTLKGELSYEYVLADTYDVQPDMILTDNDTGKITIASLKPAITYDTRDNPFDPRNGILVGLTMKLASSAFLSQVNFDKVVFNSSVYHEISKPFVLATAFRLGVSQGFGPTTILPLIERFFLGGRTTNRGYAQDTLGPRGEQGDPTGGNAFVETNLELRTALGRGIGLVTFLDSGNVWQKVEDMDLSLRSAAGLGLRYDTPVGPIRLDYGYKLKKEEGLSKGELFFSIGQAF